MYETQAFTSDTTQVNSYLASVYRWMTGALALSGYVAYFASSSEVFMNYITTHQGVFYGMLIAEVGLVIWLSWGINKMSYFTAAIAFILYATLTGATLSTIFLIYTLGSIVHVFAVTALTFGALSVYGSTTSRDLTAWRSFLFMALIGLIIASVLNIFMSSDYLTWVTTYAGIIIFAGLTAYDTQRLKRMGSSPMGGVQKMAILGALILYLDFINLFLHMLRAMGSRR